MLGGPDLGLKGSLLSHDRATTHPAGVRRARIGRACAALAGAFGVTALSLATVTTSPADAASSSGTTVQVSVPTGGFTPGSGTNGGSRHTERRLLSDNGRFAVFEASGAIVPGQKNLEWQVVRRDRRLGTTVLISKNSAGKKANARSSNPSLSADGRFTAFQSTATNLVAGDTNGVSDVFVHDAKTGATTRVSLTSAGEQVTGPSGTTSGEPSISADGRFVAFLSNATGLAPGDENVHQAYLHDRTTGTTELVSLGADGLGRSATTMTSVSADGDLLLFLSLDADVTPDAANLDVDLFLRDRAAGTTTLLAGGDLGVTHATISADGRFAAYQTQEPMVAADAGNTHHDIYAVDLTTLDHALVSASSAGVVGNAESRYPAISRDGRYLTFQSSATNLVPGNTNPGDDVFRHDRITGKTELMNRAANGKRNPLGARSPAISGDGKHVLFDSHSRSLTPTETRNWGQVFIRDLENRWPRLVAKVGKLPNAMTKQANRKVTTSGIAAKQPLQIVWKLGKKKTEQVALIKTSTLVLKAPRVRGTYTVRVSYAGQVLRTGKVRVR